MPGRCLPRTHMYPPKPTPQSEKPIIIIISSISIDLQIPFICKSMDTDQWLAISSICVVFVCCVCSIGAGYHHMRRTNPVPHEEQYASLPTLEPTTSLHTVVSS